MVNEQYSNGCLEALEVWLYDRLKAKLAADDFDAASQILTVMSRLSII